MNILIIGHGTHGKDTAAEYLNKEFGITFCSSSLKAAEIFIYDELKDKYGYKSFEECFEDRHNRRKEWHDLICGYNMEDKARLAKKIMETSNMYVGMRSNAELEECLRVDLFDVVVGVYDPRKPLEGSDSFDIDIWRNSDVVIPNAGTIEDFHYKLKKYFS